MKIANDFDEEKFRDVLELVGLDPKGLQIISNEDSDTVTLLYPNFFESVGYDKETLSTREEMLQAIEEIIEKIVKQCILDLNLVKRFRDTFFDETETNETETNETG